VHFSVALAGFIKSQVLHLQPSFSEGDFSPAAPQLNPSPVPLPVAESAGPNPVKLGLNADPAGLDAPNENPNEEVDVVEVELDVPNRSGPEGGVGIEKVFPELEPDEEAPGLGVSQTVHFSLADAGFIKSQVPHFQSLVLAAGSFSPAASQLNPPELELVVAAAAIVSVVVELVPKKSGVEGGLGIENEGDATGLAAPGLGVSHTVHFSVAEVGFIKSQVPHFHPSSCLGRGFKPAAPQLNPPFVVGIVVVEGVVKVEVEAGEVVIPVLGPALLRLEGPAEVEERLQASSIGISSSTNPLTSFSALNSPEVLPSLIVLSGSTNASTGSSEMEIERTSAFAFLGEIAAVGDTEDAEEAVSSLSALILNRSFEGSLGADDFRLKKDLPAVGEIAGAAEEAPLRPAVCN